MRITLLEDYIDIVYRKSLRKMPRTTTLTTPKKEIFNMTATKAVIYARYSSHNQREESIEGQLRECHEYAEKNNFIIIDEYCDRALSGKTDHRPMFQKLIRDSERSNTITIRSSDINGAAPLYQSYPNSLFFVKGCFGYVFLIEEI